MSLSYTIEKKWHTPFSEVQYHIDAWVTGVDGFQQLLRQLIILRDELNTPSPQTPPLGPPYHSSKPPLVWPKRKR